MCFSHASSMLIIQPVTLVLPELSQLVFKGFPLSFFTHSHDPQRVNPTFGKPLYVVPPAAHSFRFSC